MLYLFPVHAFLNSFRLLEQNTTEYVAYKQRESVFQNSEGWKSKIKFRCLVRAHFLSSHGGRNKGVLWGLFYMGTSSICEWVLVSWLNHLPEAPLPNIITLGLDFNTCECFFPGRELKHSACKMPLSFLFQHCLFMNSFLIFFLKCFRYS